MTDYTNFLTLDIENNSSGKYGRKAGVPGEDPIVAIALQNSVELRSQYIYPDKLSKLGVDEDVIVGFNLSHDLSFLWDLKDLQDFFRRGGRVWDCQLAHYILSGHQEKYPSLRDVAVRCYSCPERVKNMEDYWLNGLKTSDIPKELVLKDVEQDVKDTTSIYLQQLEQAKKDGVFKFLEYRMDALLACIECERNGMYINKDIFNTNKEKIKQELEEKKLLLSNLIKPYWR